jgi:hypothetical protein
LFLIDESASFDRAHNCPAICGLPFEKSNAFRRTQRTSEPHRSAVRAIQRNQLVIADPAPFARMRVTYSRYPGDKSFTCISASPQRITTSKHGKRFEDDSAKIHFVGIKTLTRESIQS